MVVSSGLTVFMLTNLDLMKSFALDLLVLVGVGEVALPDAVVAVVVGRIDLQAADRLVQDELHRRVDVGWASLKKFEDKIRKTV